MNFSLLRVYLFVMVAASYCRLSIDASIVRLEQFAAKLYDDADIKSEWAN